MFPTRAEIASNYRRLQRFFEQVSLDSDQPARVVVRVARVGSGPWLLALDRTSWKFGRRDVNVLMLGVVHNGIAVPVMWDVLDRAGNSTTAHREALLSRFCSVFGAKAIAGLIADREFVGTAWMTFLAENDIPGTIGNYVYGLAVDHQAVILLGCHRDGSHDVQAPGSFRIQSCFFSQGTGRGHCRPKSIRWSAVFRLPGTCNATPCPSCPDFQIRR
ncbi:hypothetical protein [Labrys sp. ZIDIC5]|uniref:hypothetical protein n=1 Tax=Labrys sedimenti TaxID=3106036 RepID=UPI002ACA2216|nr:hypothetical protein [Labrys sp. ZIDIC5]MDZ5454672.1 hypothetical protein [Labrys sp. ZIDIC5]